MANHYEVPNWAGKPPTGLHLDVTKDDKLIQKLMLDQKRCYLFGRNTQMNDFCIDHASCSRVHAAFVYHKHLNRAFLVDLGSTHGTYIGSMRLESHKPTQLPLDSTFHFGASTRYYILRERPIGGSRTIMEEIPNSTDAPGALLGLPETQNELDNLTEFNTAHNRRISMLGISTEDGPDLIKSAQNNRKRKQRGVSFNEDNDVINPEDVDPSVGRFRNLVQTTVVPTNKKVRTEFIGIHNTPSVPHDLHKHLLPSAIIPHLYQDIPPESHHISPASSMGSMGGGSRLGLVLPNPAPDVDPTPTYPQQHSMSMEIQLSGPEISMSMSETEPKKKKYAKEAWPGRKPLMSSM